MEILRLLRRGHERRAALNAALRIVEINSPYWTPEQKEAMQRGILGAYIEGEITETVNRHLGPESGMTTLYKRREDPQE